jgi:hypothetical protein
MEKKSASYEFEFIKVKLEKIASLLHDNVVSSQIEAAFIVGCLHIICHQNSIDFQGDANEM